MLLNVLQVVAEYREDERILSYALKFIATALLRWTF